VNLKFRKIIRLQNIANQFIANQLLDAFIDANKVTKSHIPVANVPSKIDILTHQVVTNEYGTRQKIGRPVGSKDINPWKRKINDSKKDLFRT